MGNLQSVEEVEVKKTPDFDAKFFREERRFKDITIFDQPTFPTLMIWVDQRARTLSILHSLTENYYDLDQTIAQVKLRLIDEYEKEIRRALSKWERSKSRTDSLRKARALYDRLGYTPDPEDCDPTVDVEEYLNFLQLDERRKELKSLIKCH